MKRALKILSLIDVIFLVILMVSGTLAGIASDIVYFLAFLIPFTMGFYYSRKLKFEREEERGLAEPLDSYFCFDRKRLFDFLPVAIPAVLDIFILAALTSLLLSAFGFSNPQPENTDILTMLIVHALCPCVLEEMLFRYIPMKLIAPYSKRWCVILSALFFALIHANLFQMPYAFLAGLIFMCLNLALDSIWPSLILHLLNNSASVIWLKYCTGSTSKLIFVSVLVLLAAVSWVFIILKRERYKNYLCKALDKGIPEFDSRSFVALSVISLYIAVAGLFA